MKKIKMIINPSSGRQTFQKKIDAISIGLLDRGFLVSRYYTEKKHDAEDETIKSCGEDWDIIIACGGDGTVNEVANGIVRGNRKIPVAILSSGTVNDFSTLLRMPSYPETFFDMIENGVTRDVDLGKAGENYFANVAAGGFLANIPHQVSSESKTALGRIAYYVEGIKELPRVGFSPKKVRIVSKEHTLDEEIVMFLITNTSSIGGFKKFAPFAEIEDGLLDCLIIKKSDFPSIVSIFLNLRSGKHINHPNVLYFKTKDIYIESDEEIQIDIDGDFGGTLPARFQAVPKAFRVFSID